MRKSPIKTLGRIVQDHRKAIGISQEQLADLAGIHRTYVSQLERGLKSPTLPVLMRIAKALGTRASVLIQHLESATQP